MVNSADAVSRASTTMAPEQRALLCCARSSLDDASRQRLRAIAAEGLDGRMLVAEAGRHGVSTLLSRHIREVFPPGKADELVEELRADVHATVVASLAAAAELAALVSALKDARVPVLAIKGPISAMLCYGDLGVRRYGDLDLLIRPSDLPSARRCVEARGYAPRFALTDAWQARLVRTQSELGFLHADGRRAVDLHWRLLPPRFSFVPDDVGPFARRASVRIGSDDVPTLGLEATLLFLLLHGIKHDWERLSWLCDVAELLRRHPELDWNEVMQWSSAPGRRRLIDVGLALVHGLLDAPVPMSVLARAERDPAVHRIAATLARKLFTAPGAPPSWLPRSIFSMQLLLAMERPSDRLRFVHDVVFRPTPLEWRAVPLPPALAPVFYLVRPARLFWKHVWPGRATAA